MSQAVPHSDAVSLSPPTEDASGPRLAGTNSPSPGSPASLVDWPVVATVVSDLITSPLFVFDVTNRVVVANEPMAVLFGWRRHELVGQRLSDLWPSLAEESCWLAGVQEALSGLKRTCDCDLHTKEGRLIHCSLAFTLIVGRAGTPAVVVVVREARAAPVAQDAKESGHGDIAQRVIESAGASDTSGPAAVEPSSLDGSAALTNLVDVRLKSLAARAQLSAREEETLKHLITGRALEDIAVLMQISVRTVKFHQANVLQKLGADSRVDLLRVVF